MVPSDEKRLERGRVDPVVARNSFPDEEDPSSHHGDRRPMGRADTWDRCLRAPFNRRRASRSGRRLREEDTVVTRNALPNEERSISGGGYARSHTTAGRADACGARETISDFNPLHQLLGLPEQSTGLARGEQIVVAGNAAPDHSGQSSEINAHGGPVFASDSRNVCLVRPSATREGGEEETVVARDATPHE